MHAGTDMDVNPINVYAKGYLQDLMSMRYSVFDPLSYFDFFRSIQSVNAGAG